MTDSENPFQILNKDISQATEVSPSEISGDTTERIETLLKSAKVLVFMKGNSQMPQCGFSANTVATSSTWVNPLQHLIFFRIWI